MPTVTSRRALRRQTRDRAALTLAAGGIAAILLLAGLLIWVLTPGGAVARIGGPFSLIDDRGAMVTDHSFPGKYLLVYFGYTKCRDVCPATLNTVAAALDRLGGKAARVQPLFITVDPERDTPAALRKYVALFTPRLIGLSGTAADIRKVADEYHVVRAIRQMDGTRDYAVDHSSVLYLMAPDGRFVAPIPVDASEMVVAQALARYVS
jgi:protein SCO1/2